MQLSQEEIKHIADLARLELTDDELSKYGEQLSAVLGYIDQLSEVDVEGVEPTAQVTGLVDVWREDEILDWPRADIDLALRDAPDFEDGFIKVKRVLE